MNKLRRAIFDFLHEVASINLPKEALISDPETRHCIVDLGYAEDFAIDAIDLDILAEQLETVVTDAMKVD